MTMTKSETSTSKELHGSAEETDKQNYSEKELVELIEVENTPFTIVRQEDKYYVNMGMFRFTEGLTKEEAEEDAKRVDWFRMMQVMGAMIEKFQKI